MQTWYRNYWIQSAGVVTMALVILVIGQAFWILPKVEAHDAILAQIKNAETQSAKILSGAPDLFQLKRNLMEEDSRLAPIRKDVEKAESQLHSEEETVIFDKIPGAVRKVTETSDEFGTVMYSIDQKGPYKDVIHSLRALEAMTPFLKVSSLQLGRRGNEIIMHVDFLSLFGTDKEKQIKVQSGRLERLPASSRDPFADLPQEQTLAPAPAS